MDEFNIEELDERNRTIQREFLLALKDQGAVLKRVSVPLVKYMLPLYYSLIPSEAATNLSRYDGIKYGHQPDFLPNEDLMEYVERVRSETFGPNVKRRVVLGNFLLSSKFESFNEKVRRAQKIRRLLITQWCTMMECNDIDIVVSPTTIGEEPPLIRDLQTAKPDPVKEFKMDYFTAFPNTLGIPSVTLPVHQDSYKMPSSVKLHSYFGEDYHLLRAAKQIE